MAYSMLRRTWGRAAGGMSWASSTATTRTVGPCVLGDRVEGGGEVRGANVEVLTPGSDGAENAADAEIAGICVGESDVEGDHVALDGEVRVLPCGEGFDGEVAGLRGRRNGVELLADLGGLLALAGFSGGAGRGRSVGAGVACGKAEGGQKESGG